LKKSIHEIHWERAAYNALLKSLPELSNQWFAAERYQSYLLAARRKPNHTVKVQASSISRRFGIVQAALIPDDPLHETTDG
jgi:hypothetical protein